MHQKNYPEYAIERSFEEKDLAKKQYDISSNSCLFATSIKIKVTGAFRIIFMINKEYVRLENVMDVKSVGVFVSDKECTLSILIKNANDICIHVNNEEHLVNDCRDISKTLLNLICPYLNLDPDLFSANATAVI